MFDIAKEVAKLRFLFHANMTSIVNAANQLGLIKDEAADKMNENHFLQCMDALERKGYDVQGYFEKMSKNE